MDEKFFDTMIGTIVLFDKAYTTFKQQHPMEDDETINKLIKIWWEGLMGGAYRAANESERNRRNDNGIGGIDGFSN